ncbi:hypothetical protein COLO4_18903 [Corchorus olitorius]|uniref:Uncharacterized protein n=1 Tax=Corchorus olitorius TaxID=93759 RepID=A0A1R3J7B4_9ROSI|nr:hypothetical protein COLO4_18903 [Corchorus olitorius]
MEGIDDCNVESNLIRQELSISQNFIEPQQFPTKTIKFTLKNPKNQWKKFLSYGRQQCLLTAQLYSN